MVTQIQFVVAFQLKKGKERKVQQQSEIVLKPDTTDQTGLRQLPLNNFPSHFFHSYLQQGLVIDGITSMLQLQMKNRVMGDSTISSL